MAQRPMTDSLPAEEWAGEMGERWLAHLQQFEGMIAPIGQALMSRAGFRHGERVVDLGCGAGGTSLDIARETGAQGEVLGIDISSQLIAAAQQRARAAHADNVKFQCADAATVVLDSPPFDRLFSRFGLMFFPDPTAAFRNLRTLVRRDGQIDFCVWAPARENGWVAQMMEIVGRSVQLPTPVPRAPGPFALDDPSYVRELLEQAGFVAATFDTWEGDQLVGGAGANPQVATDFVFDAMSFGRLLEESPPTVRARVQAELTGLFGRWYGVDGVRMPGKAYLVGAVAGRRA
jgi:SAM-dependent methyltransferase